MRIRSTACAVLLALAAVPAAAQDATPEPGAGGTAVAPAMPLDEATPEGARPAFFATAPAGTVAWSEIDDAEVIGSDGEEIGEVEDILVGLDGRIQAVILEGEDDGEVALRMEALTPVGGPGEDFEQDSTGSVATTTVDDDGELRFRASMTAADLANAPAFAARAEGGGSRGADGHVIIPMPD